MKDNIAKISRWVLYLLLALSVISGVVFYLFYDSGRALTVLLEDLNNQYLNEFLYWGAILLALTIIVTVISPIYGYIINPKNLGMLLISLGIAAVIVVIAYMFADNTVTEVQAVKYDLTQAGSKRVGVGLYTTYIAFGLAILALLYSSVVRIFK